MSELTAPDSTSVGLTRLGRDAAVTADELGPLADLIGTWIGSHGWELIAVPNGNGFRLIARPYVEVLTFEALGAPVPNRGGSSDMFIAGLLYQMRICDRATNEPLHLENGMWLNLGEKGGANPIVRQASIPHGDVFLALGTASVTKEPEIPSISGLPKTGPGAPLGYTDPYLQKVEAFDPSRPNGVLEEMKSELEKSGLKIEKTTTLSVSTLNDGGIVNIPFVEEHAKTSHFECTYWIETIRDPETGDEVQQLQYSQQTNLEFHPRFEEPGLIMWPHINVNTMRKQ